MSYDQTGKGKGKRPIGDFDSDFPVQHVPRALYPEIPDVVARHRNRRRNVAAKVWGAQLPSHPANAPGEPFNVYKAILRHPNLFFQFAIRLDIRELENLYAIDKEFHYRFNKYSISIIHENAMYHAPLAAYNFSWTMFPDLCISDPMARPMDGRSHLARDTPSLRWIKMVLSRQRTVSNIIMLLAAEDHRIPRAAYTMIMKLWLLMEIQTMARRTTFVSDREVWTDQDFHLFHLFLVKLDMRFSHPVIGNGACALSHLLLTQPSLCILEAVLSGTKKLNYNDAEDMTVRSYDIMELAIDDDNAWQVDEWADRIPLKEWGMMSKEYADWQGDRLVPVPDLLFLEAIHRELHTHRYILDYVTYGFVEVRPGGELRNVPKPTHWYITKDTRQEAWPTEDERKEFRGRMEKRVGYKKQARVPLRELLVATTNVVVDALAVDEAP
ncbi:unnamed protein product [Periconia digitata]|uniref:Uncharacterized protein n=1 Tax=Periconia digitata TaxID=1303443 RepID=A0A9W4U574_9PLEO|nr:unnamed protein product [Periconia digitata]